MLCKNVSYGDASNQWTLRVAPSLLESCAKFSSGTNSAPPLSPPPNPTFPHVNIFSSGRWMFAYINDLSVSQKCILLSITLPHLKYIRRLLITMLPSVILFALLPALALAMPSPLGKRFTSRTIRSGRDGKCLSLSVTAPFPSNGAEVFTEPCSAASLWDIDEGSGSILLAAHTGFALDAGSNPQNNGGLKVWQSYPGLFQQT